MSSLGFNVGNVSTEVPELLHSRVKGHYPSAGIQCFRFRSHFPSFFEVTLVRRESEEIRKSIKLQLKLNAGNVSAENSKLRNSEVLRPHTWPWHVCSVVRACSRAPKGSWVQLPVRVQRGGNLSLFLTHFNVPPSLESMKKNNNTYPRVKIKKKKKTSHLESASRYII